MIYHLEDPPKSGAFKRTGWWYHYATLCGLSFMGGGAEHRIAEPGAVATCPDCNAKRAGGEK